MDSSEAPARLTVDAMFAGLARWLRLLGHDTTFVPGITDHELVRHALAERRVLISADCRLFLRRELATGQLTGLQVPVGLTLGDQVRFVVGSLHLVPGPPRCTACNGLLDPVRRADVGDVVPARSLIWGRRFHRCRDCGRVFWEGTHWGRIRGFMRALSDAERRW
jgi:uncharacterized protein with PIN domain